MRVKHSLEINFSTLKHSGGCKLEILVKVSQYNIVYIVICKYKKYIYMEVAALSPSKTSVLLSFTFHEELWSNSLKMM